MNISSNTTKDILNAPIRVCVMGSACSGKSLVISSILGDIAMPINTLSRHVACNISYGSTESYKYNGAPITREAITAGRYEPNGLLEITVSRELLSEADCIISELQETDLPVAQMTPYALLCHIGICDACIYLIHAQMPLSKTDAEIIRYLLSKGVPVHVFVSRLDFLDEEDRESVYQYVSQELPESTLLRLYPLSLQVTDVVHSARTEIFSNLENGKNARRFSFAADIQAEHAEKRKQALETAQARYEEQLRKVDIIRREKEEQLLNKTKKLHGIADMLHQREKELAESIHNHLYTNIKQEMLRHLQHGLNTTADAKQFWDNSLAYLMENQINNSRMGIERIIQLGIQAALQEADAALKTIKYHVPHNAAPRFVSIEIQPGKAPEANVEDIGRAKWVARVGSALAVGVGGALLATTGIGFAMMGIPMATGAFTNWLVERKEKQNKQELSGLLPQAVDQYLGCIETSFQETSSEIFGELCKSIMTAGQECHAAEMEQIEQETKRAKHNCGEDLRKFENNLTETTTH